MINKAILINALFLFCLFNRSLGQQKFTRYCEMVFQYHSTSKTVGPDGKNTIDAGDIDNRSPFKDSTILISLKKVEKLKTLSGALDYLTDLGWKTDAILPIPGPGALVVRVVLRKEFNAADVNIITP